MTETIAWVKWRFDKWRNDEGLRMCSLAARGLWADLLAIMHGCVPYGHLTINGRAPSPRQVASLVGAPEKEVAGCLRELTENGVCSVTDAGVMFSRKMVRDQVVSINGRAVGAAGGNPEIRRGTVPKEHRVRPYKRSENPAKTERIFQRSGGVCHWCSKPLQRDRAGHDFYHVDHVVAICDGGTNDEDNLVAACADCNHQRARVDWTDSNRSHGDANQPVDVAAQATATLEKERERERETDNPLDPPKRRSRVPEDWWPDAKGIAFAHDHAVDPAVEVPRFRDHHLAKGSLMASWAAAWRTWVQNAVKFRGNGQSKPNGANGHDLLDTARDERITEDHKGLICNGYYLDHVSGRLADAVGINVTLTDRTMIQWLADGYEPDEFVAVVRRVVQHASAQPKSLAYFDKAVREERPTSRPLAAQKPPEDPEIFRERGAVASFVRSDGTEWRWPGPRPHEPGCTIRKSVLDEFAAKIEAAVAVGQRKAEDMRMMRQ